MKFRKEIDYKTKKPLAHIELLACGHQNNLLLSGNKSGKCPKNCKDPELSVEAAI